MDKPIGYPPPPSARRNRGEPVLQRLRRDILLNHYEPGERLPPERELSARLGTNRNTLREVLRTLEADNLVRARQGDGTIVLDWRAIGEINLLPHFFAEDTPALERIDAVSTLLELRSILVDQVITLAIERGGEDDWDLVFDAFEALRGAPVGPRAVVADVVLFRMITLATHNLVLIWVFNTFSKIFVELGRRFPQLWRIDNDYLRAMDKVVGHLREGRGDRARRGMSRLLDSRAGDVARQLRSLAAPREDISTAPVVKTRRATPRKRDTRAPRRR